MEDGKPIFCERTSGKTPEGAPITESNPTLLPLLHDVLLLLVFENVGYTSRRWWARIMRDLEIYGL
jgi:hypothetical protein